MGQLDRLDRLIATLRARGTATMAELASELAVTPRTIRRDVERLRERGLDIEGERGRGGGIRLARQARLPPIQLSEDEVVALYLSVALLDRLPDMPFGARSAPALTKVVASLPDGRRRALRSLVKRVIVGPPAGSAALETVVPMPATLLVCVEHALSERRCLSFRYTDIRGAHTERLVEPHGLLCRPPVWYMITHDRRREAPRVFRLDRIEDPVVGEATFQARPELVAEMARAMGA